MLFAIAVLALAQGTLEERISTVLPTAAEDKWLQIPWRTNLIQARAEAQVQGKPMFLWIMNGSPLGCT
jgi:hypothetical protein